MQAYKKLSGRMMQSALCVLILAFGVPAIAGDPPHTNDCVSCHITHGALGSWLGVRANANLCQSCHYSGGAASASALPLSSQALPWPGLPGGISPSGTSHRWDSGVAGHLVYLGGASTNSTGTLIPGGIYTGVYAKAYTITIYTTGNVGTARFNWTSGPLGAGGNNGVMTSTNPISLNEGITLAFANGPGGTGTSFQVNDKWNIYVRPDILAPTNTAVLKRTLNGAMVCSTCHDQHSQANTPFDPSAPAYTGTNSGSGRHFMRINNDTEQLCVDCHTPRNVTNGVSGSHPVGIVLNNYTGLTYRATTNLPLEKDTGKVRCLSCHNIHFAQANDGNLLRVTNSLTLCVECHTLANTATPGSHFSSVNGNTLWPGGKYGSTFPQRTNAKDRGTCVNCHAPHGWPDASNPATHYPNLLLDYQENLCYTCHGTNGPAIKLVQTDFASTYSHPVADSSPWRRQGRTVECLDCHNPHKAETGSHNYTNMATAFRGAVSNVPSLKGMDGVSFNYAGLTNFQVVATNRYAYIPATTGATNEYQVCFKCHTGRGYPNYNSGTASFTNSGNIVAGSGTAWSTNMIGMWIANTNGTQMYAITNVVSTNSLAITPPYAGATASGQTYFIQDPPTGLTPYYNTGQATFTSGSTAVSGTGTAWNSGMVGSSIYGSNNPSVVYKIIRVNSTTSLTIYPAYQ